MTAIETDRLCSVAECDRTVNARGLCTAHYSRWRRGSPVDDRPVGPAGLMGVPVAERLHIFSAAGSDGCVIYTGPTNPSGYGYIKHDGRSRRAHRVAYEIAVGPVPEGLELDHLCGVRNCINPEHLGPVTHAENTLRSQNPCAINARKTACKRGHDFTPENTYLHPDGRRECRECGRLRRSGAVAA